MTKKKLFVLFIVLYFFGLIFISTAPLLYISTECASPQDHPQKKLVTPLPDYERSQLRSKTIREDQAYLRFPEWYIVYSAQEYADHVQKHPPSSFQFVQSIRAYWQSYCDVNRITSERYAYNGPSQTVLKVIGPSFSIEYLMKGLYEQSVGRLSEMIAGYQTADDLYAAGVAYEYGQFLTHTPWYDFPFGQKLYALWSGVPFNGTDLIRQTERRVLLTFEFGVKALYGKLIGYMTKTGYAPDDLTIKAVVRGKMPAGSSLKGIELSGGRSIVSLPRYSEFTSVALELTASGVDFLDIAGNDMVLISIIGEEAPTNMPRIHLVSTIPLATSLTQKRYAVEVQVSDLSLSLRELRAKKYAIEHIYDY